MKALGSFVAVLLVCTGAAAQHRDGGPVHVMMPWSRALPPVAENGATYVTLANRAASPDELVGASSPIADRVEIHTHVMEAGVVKMRRVDSVALPPGEYVELAPGGLHLMLFGLKEPLKEGDEFPMTLQFEKSEPVEVTVTVRAAGARAPKEPGGEENHAHETRKP